MNVSSCFTKKNSYTFFIRLSVCIGFLAAATLLSYGLKSLGMHMENIIMAYLLGVVLLVVMLKKLWWGIALSVLSVLAINFFFTQPYYTLKVNDPNYIVTFIVFLAVSILVGGLANRLQKNLTLAKVNEARTSLLCEFSNNLLNISGIEAISDYCVKRIKESFPAAQSAVFLTASAHADKRAEDGIVCRGDAILFDYADSVNKHLDDNLGGQTIAESVLIFPLKNNRKILGAVAFRAAEPPTLSQRELLRALAAQTALALDREQLFIERRQTAVAVAKERLRNSLLRSVSHDIRTPLTGIAGSVDLVVQQFDSLEKEEILELLRDAGEDAVWLNNLVENLLNMTRIEDGRQLVNKSGEVVDDVVTEAVGRVKKRLGAHTLKVTVPKDVVLVPMDGRLIVQVLLNLLNNALKHTRPDAEICLSVETQDGKMCFTVSDNGGGIPQGMQEKLFDNFVTLADNKRDDHRGMGLGLGICKSIVEAHQGEIRAFDNGKGGASFEFTLPLTDKKENAL